MPKNKAASLYFVNAPIDFLFIGGLSLLSFAIFNLSGDAISYDSVIAGSLFLLWIGNWPHFAASNYRLYSSRENIRQYPLTAIVVPFVILAGVLGAFLSPQNFAPFWIKLFLLWSPFHFSGQSVGITLLYTRRAGIILKPWERYTFAAFIFLTFLFPNWASDTNPVGGGYYGIEYPGLGVPNWFSYTAEVLILVFGAALAVIFATRYQSKKERLPWVVLLPAITQYVWFVAGRSTRNFYILVPFFHSIQYMFIAWVLQLKLKKDEQKIAGSRTYVTVESLRWGVINIFGGITLFYLFPRFCSWFGYPLDFATGVAIVGVQLHHFFVDGVIWKLRNPAVSAPLMGSFSELLKTTRYRRPLRSAA
ncbi:MAG: hypothetical protein H6617_06200 [Bdellovibrionaceae bacterium]|nr:hypothetical protein [Pseudobdellovibrionaceae bacterium]